MNLSALQAQTRLQLDIKATKTIAITLAAYFCSYVPAIVYGAVGQQVEGHTGSWFAFIAWYATSFSGPVNPLIYYLWTSRFRSAFKQFIKDPFESSDFKEKPSGRANGREKRNLTGAAAITKTNGSRAESTKRFHGERRHGVMVLSIEPLQAANLCVLETSESGGEGKVKLWRGEAVGAEIAAAAAAAAAVEGNKDGNEEVSKKSALGDKYSRDKYPSSKISSRKTRNKAEEKEDLPVKSGSENESGKGKCPSSSKIVHPEMPTRGRLDINASWREKIEVFFSTLLKIQETKNQEYLGKRRNAVIPDC